MKLETLMFYAYTKIVKYLAKDQTDMVNFNSFFWLLCTFVADKIFERVGFGYEIEYRMGFEFN